MFQFRSANLFKILRMPNEAFVDDIWSSEIDEFVSSSKHYAMLSRPVTSETEELLVRTSCSARRVFCCNPQDYSATLQFSPHGPEIFSFSPTATTRIRQPIFFRLAKYPQACAIPMIAPLKVISSHVAFENPVFQAMLGDYVSQFGTRQWPSKPEVAVNAGAMLSQIALMWVPQSKIFLSGSVCLGICDITTDTDFVLVVPNLVPSREFFSVFLPLLRTHNELTRIESLQSTFVPLIRAVFQGTLKIEICLVRSSKVKNIFDDDILMDESSAASWSGPKNAELIRLLVSPQYNYHRFGNLLRIIRFWSKSRGIYSAKHGFLGGISWAILAGFICQLTQAKNDVESMFWFFEIFSVWNWQEHPIQLCKSSWQAICKSDHQMPILTPSVPPRDTASQVTKSGRRIIQMELVRGKKCLLNFMTKLESLALFELFAPVGDLTKEANSLVMKIFLHAQTEQECCRWVSLVDSRVRKLCVLLEKIAGVDFVRLNPVPEACANGGAVIWIVISILSQGELNLSLIKSTTEFFSSTNLSQSERGVFKVTVFKSPQMEIVDTF